MNMGNKKMEILNYVINKKIVKMGLKMKISRMIIFVGQDNVWLVLDKL
jgi:hypothetical protein